MNGCSKWQVYYIRGIYVIVYKIDGLETIENVDGLITEISVENSF